jgi:hypothetical protein
MDHVSPLPPRCTNAWHSLAFKARKKKRMGEKKKIRKKQREEGGKQRRTKTQGQRE